MFSDNKEPDWTSVGAIMDILKKRGESNYGTLEGRMDTIRYRLEQERHAKDKIGLFGGDFYAEKIAELNLPEVELEELKRARDRGVKVKILGRLDASSPDLLHWAQQYVNEELSSDTEAKKKGGKIELRTWGKGIRGGFFDDDRAYLIQRQYAIPPQEITIEYLQSSTPKEVGRTQDDITVPLQTLTTSSDYIVKKLAERFAKEWSASVPMINSLSVRPMLSNIEIGKDALPRL